MREEDATYEVYRWMIGGWEEIDSKEFRCEDVRVCVKKKEGIKVFKESERREVKKEERKSKLMRVGKIKF